MGSSLILVANVFCKAFANYWKQLLSGILFAVPLQHYLKFEYFESQNPSSYFSTSFMANSFSFVHMPMSLSLNSSPCSLVFICRYLWRAIIFCSELDLVRLNQHSLIYFSFCLRHFLELLIILIDLLKQLQNLISLPETWMTRAIQNIPGNILWILCTKAGILIPLFWEFFTLCNIL